MKERDKSIISDGSIQSLIEVTPLDEEQKKKILEDLPYMDEEARIFLLGAIRDIFIIEEEKQKAIQRAKELGS